MPDGLCWKLNKSIRGIVAFYAPCRGGWGLPCLEGGAVGSSLAARSQVLCVITSPRLQQVSFQEELVITGTSQEVQETASEAASIDFPEMKTLRCSPC